MTRPTVLLLAGVGFISLLGQVILLRELAAVLYGSELVMILALGAWMSGTAIGALAGRPLQPPSPRLLRVLLSAGALLIVLGIVWCRGARPALGGVPGAYLPFPKQLAAIAVALLPAAIVFGAVFQAAARQAIQAGGSLPGAYAVESAGALAGGIVATAALRLGVPNLVTGVLCAILALAAALRPGKRLLTGLTFAFGSLGLLLETAPLDRWMTSWTHAHLLATRDTPYGRATVTASEGQVAVFQNDVLAFETQGTAAEEFVHPAALQLPRVERVLVLEGGSSGLVAAVLDHRPRWVDSVELDRALNALVMRVLPDNARRPLLSAKVATLFEDPRRYVRLAGRHGVAYDLVLVGAPEPASAQTNRFYTREFFAECAALLGEGGVLALRLPSAENYWVPALVGRTASIERALRSVFPSVLVLPGATTLALASRSPLASDPETLIARWDTRDLHPRLTTPAYIRYLYTNDRVASVASQLAAAKAPANSDARPVCYPYALMIWLAMFHPTLARMDPIAWTSSVKAAVLLATAAAGLWLIVRRSQARHGAVVAAAGAAGMLLEAVLLLSYQSRHGVLYQDLGALLGVFMLGLTAGAWAVHALARGRRVRRLSRRKAGFVIFAALFLTCVFISARLRGDALPGLAGTAAGLFLAGALTAAVFAHVSLGLHDPARGAGPLYAADLAGGVAGSILGSLIAIPVLGLPGAALAAAVLAVAAALWL